MSVGLIKMNNSDGHQWRRCNGPSLLRLDFVVSAALYFVVVVLCNDSSHM